MLTPEELSQATSRFKPRNTERGENTWERAYAEFAQKVGAPALQDLSDEQINLFLPNFFTQLKRQDGATYALNTTRNVMYALQRIFQTTLKRTNVVFASTGPFSPVFHAVNNRMIKDAASRKCI